MKIDPPSLLILPNRRRFLHGSATLSAAAVALLAGRHSLAAQADTRKGDPAADARILNTALAAEHEAIAAYQLGADSGLLRTPTRDLALQFQGHHKAHVELLAQTVAKLGGKPAESRQKYDFPVATLKAEADVLRFASGLERGAVSAYLGAVPLFGNPELAKAAASILGDEAMHWAILRQALGEDPVPSAFVS